MGTTRLLAAVVVVVFSLPGCAETLSGGWLNSRTFSGNLMETKTPEGKIKRLSVTDLESWQRWNHNPIKGNGDTIVIKAEATF